MTEQEGIDAACRYYCKVARAELQRVGAALKTRSPDSRAVNSTTLVLLIYQRVREDIERIDPSLAHLSGLLAVQRFWEDIRQLAAGSVAEVEFSEAPDAP